MPRSETQRESRETTVGKVKSIFGQGKNFSEKQNDNNEKQPGARLSNVKASKIKKLFNCFSISE